MAPGLQALERSRTRDSNMSNREAQVWGQNPQPTKRGRFEKNKNKERTSIVGVGTNGGRVTKRKWQGKAGSS